MSWAENKRRERWYDRNWKKRDRDKEYEIKFMHASRRMKPLRKRPSKEFGIIEQLEDLQKQGCWTAIFSFMHVIRNMLQNLGGKCNLMMMNWNFHNNNPCIFTSVWWMDREMVCHKEVEIILGSKEVKHQILKEAEIKNQKWKYEKWESQILQKY